MPSAPRHCAKPKKPTALYRFTLITALFAGAVVRPADALSLVESYRAALDNDPMFQGARFDRQAGEEHRAIGLSNLLPSIGLSYGYSKNEGEIIKATPDPRVYDSKIASVNIRQPLFNMEAWRRYQGSNALASSSVSRFAAAEQDLILRLTTAYLEALLAEDQLRLAMSQRDAYKENQIANQRMFEMGAGTRTDMAETSARYQIAEALVIETQNGVNNKRNELAVIIGGDAGMLDSLPVRLPELPMSPASLADWEALAREHNPDIRTQQYAAEYVATEVERNRAGHYPRVDLVASYSQNTADSLFFYQQESKMASVGVQLSLPLYSGGGVSAQTRQATARLSSERAALDAATHKALVEVRKQFQLVSSSRTRMQAMESAERSAAEAVDAIRKSVAGGLRVNLDVLTALQQLFTTRRDLSDARHGYLLAHLRLRAAAGVLNQEDLALIGACFEPRP